MSFQSAIPSLGHGRKCQAGWLSPVINKLSTSDCLHCSARARNLWWPQRRRHRQHVVTGRFMALQLLTPIKQTSQILILDILRYSYISNNWWSSTTAEEYFTFVKLLICSLTLFMAWTGNNFRSSSLQPYQGQLHFMTLSVPSPLSGEFLGVIFLPPSLPLALCPKRG